MSTTLTDKQLVTAKSIAGNTILAAALEQGLEQVLFPEIIKTTPSIIQYLLNAEAARPGFLDLLKDAEELGVAAATELYVIAGGTASDLPQAAN